MLKKFSRYIALSVLFLSTIVVLSGCFGKPYEKLKMNVSESNFEIVLSDDKTQNFFDVSVSVTNRPKKYDGKVNVASSNPKSVKLSSQSNVDNGKTNLQFEAIGYGESIITITSLEGNLVRQISVTVIKEIEGLAFRSNSFAIPKNEMVDISKDYYIEFSPFDTNQKQLAYTFTATGLNWEQELAKIIVSGSKIFIPNDFALPKFVVTATSVSNPEIFSSTEIVVMESVADSEIKLFNTNKTDNDLSDDVELEKIDGKYFIELATNEELFSTAQFAFRVGDNGGKTDSYIYEIVRFNNSYVDAEKVVGKTNEFLLSTMGIAGEIDVEFVLKNKTLPEQHSLYKHVTVTVRSIAFPKKVLLTSNEVEVDTLTLYKNYSQSSLNKLGTPIKATILENANDKNSEIKNQKFYLNFANFDSKLEVRDENYRLYRDGSIVYTGTTLYVKYDMQDLTNLPVDAKIIFTSVSNKGVSSELNIEFYTKDFELVVLQENRQINIDKSIRVSGERPYGYGQVIFYGLPVDFNYNTFSVVDYDTKLISIYKSSNELGFVGLGVKGATPVTIVAENGYSVVVNVTVFESINEATTKVRIAGSEINSASGLLTLSELLSGNNANIFKFKNGISLDLEFSINGGKYEKGVSSDIIAFTTSKDIINDNVVPHSSFVKVVKNPSLIATQNYVGKSLIEIRLIGFNEEGKQLKEITFKFVIEISVPISVLKTNSGEATIYDINNLSPQQLITHGSHDIVLITDPENASITYNDIKWTILYGTSTISGVKTENGNVVTYNFALSNDANVILTTSKTNYKVANVKIAINSGRLQDLIFQVQILINQNHIDQSGAKVESWNQTNVKFFAKYVLKVTDIILENVISHSISFDSRELQVDDYGNFQINEEKRTKYVNFSVLPADALTKNLAVKYQEGVGVVATIENDKNRVKIVVYSESKIGKPIDVIIYAVDSVNSQNNFRVYNTLSVEILDGKSEELAFKVSSASDLIRINNNLNAYYVLTNNINLSEIQGAWTPIGQKNVSDKIISSEFEGQLNGAYTVGQSTYYYSISGLKYVSTSDKLNYNYFGLFGIIGRKGVVKNITFTNINIDFNDYERPNSGNTNTIDDIAIGTVAGINRGVVENITINDGNNVESTNSQIIQDTLIYSHGIHFQGINADKVIGIGGVVGINLNKIINNKSYLFISFSDSQSSVVYAGGIAGINYGKDAIISKNLVNNEKLMSDSFDTFVVFNSRKDTLGQLTSGLNNNNSAIGGIVGYNTGEVSNLVVRNIVVTALDNVGGAVGISTGTTENSAVINNVLSVPTIKGRNFIGGLVGTNFDVDNNEYYKLSFVNESSNIITTKISKSNEKPNSRYSSIISNNKVEFVDYKEKISTYNSGVVGENYIGGLIGKAVGKYLIESNLNDQDDKEINFSSAITNNSVFSYYTNRLVSNYYTKTDKDTNMYYGDIVLAGLLKQQLTQSGQMVAGGIIGFAQNVLLYSNSFNGIIQGNADIIGGVAGEVVVPDKFDLSLQDIENAGANTIAVHNTSVNGVIINHESESGNEDDYMPLNGMILGESFRIAQVEGFDVSASNLYRNILVDGNIEKEKIILDDATISNSFGSMLDKDDNVISQLVVNNNVNTHNVFVVDVQDITNFIKNWSERLSKSQQPIFDYVVVTDQQNVFDTDMTSNGINDADDQLILFNLSQQRISLDINSNATKKDIDDRLAIIESSVRNTLKNLFESVWYVNNDLNNGVPVLLSQDKFSIEFLVEDGKITFTVVVDLLSNWIPQDIIVTPKINNVNIWKNSVDSEITLYYSEIRDGYYVGENINFGDKTKRSLTAEFERQLKEENTYQLKDLLNIQTIPSFIGSGAYFIESTNSKVIAVENVNGKQILVAKGVGTAELKISSTYNKGITKTIVINVVRKINSDKYIINKSSGNSNTQLKNFENFTLIKSTEESVKTVVLNALQQNYFTFNSDETGKVVFNNKPNTNSGIRYYMLSEATFTENGNDVVYNTIYHENELSNINTDFVKINNSNYSKVVRDGRIMYYIDVPYNASAVLTNYNNSTEDSVKFLAVPYVVSNNEILELYSGSDEYGRISVKNSEEFISAKGFEYLKQFSVKTIDGTSDLRISENSVGIDVMTQGTFNVSLKTDNQNELLYMNFYNDDNQSLTVEVDEKIVGRFFKIGTLTITAISNYDDVLGMKNYSFRVFVDENDRISKTYLDEFKTINEISTRVLRFFTVYNNTVIKKEADGFITNDINSVAEYSNFNKPLVVTLYPQEIKNVSILHYPNGEVKYDTVVEDGVEKIAVSGNQNEVAYNNIIPGTVGVLKINISPYFANFNYVDITSSSVGNGIISYQQLLASYTKDISGKLIFNDKYSHVYPQNDVIDGGIRLTKRSFIVENQPSLNYGNVYFDGYLYVRTLISSYTSIENNINVNVRVHYTNSNGVIESVVHTLPLKVEVPPYLNINYQGAKNAPLAIGTSLQFEADLFDVSGVPVFSSSYVKNSDNIIIGGYGNLFNIRSLSNNRYEITTSTALSQGNDIVIVGKISKTINGIVYNFEDTLTLKLANFTINGITAENIIDGKLVGEYNQKIALKAKLNVTYNPNIVGVAEEIRKIEVLLSTQYRRDTWMHVVDGLLNLNTGYSTTRTFIISEYSYGVGYDASAVGYKLQNIQYNSNDVLMVMAKFVYTNKGIEIYDSENSNHIAHNIYKIDLSSEFRFGFYKLSSETAPEPIRNQEELSNMQTDGSYILLNDITLENWKPISSEIEIASLDGNGYVLTLNSFDFSGYENDASGLQLGIFETISQNTTLQNIIVEIAPKQTVNIQLESVGISSNENVDLLVDTTRFVNVNFGILAGTNNGIITNASVVYDGSTIKLERDLRLIWSNNYFIEFDKYYKRENGKITSYLQDFNYEALLRDNLSKYFPRYSIKDTNKPIYDTNKNLVDFSNLNQIENIRRDLSIVRVNTNISTTIRTNYISGFVANNTGYITNSNVENVTIDGYGYVSGFVANNTGKISSSYFKGANVVNRATTSTNSATAGLVVFNRGNANIQYSYAMGRAGNGDSFVYGKYTEEENKEILLTTPNTYSDKTGINLSLKQKFAGYAYTQYSNTTNYKDYNYLIGSLRAMNSAIIASSNSGGFVYSNSGFISNSYSNILVNSNTSSAGFVFVNDSGGVISDVYSLSSVQTTETLHNPFTGKNPGATNFNNLGTISYAHYLKLDVTISGNTVKDNFHDTSEIATSINGYEFNEYNTFQGYAFNQDFSENSGIERGVWFIPNGNELKVADGNDLSVIESYFKPSSYHSQQSTYLFGRPELVAANLKTLRIRVLISNADDEYNVYEDIIAQGQSITNPYLIRTAEEFNKYIVVDTKTSEGYKVLENSSIRMVRDITFNNIDVKAKTYLADYYGDLDGNGMSISQLRLISNNDYEIIDSQKTHIEKLGLFGSISSYTNNGNKIVGSVRNLTINVNEVMGTGVKYVGVLAGTINDAFIYNIEINGTNVVHGKNVVGGLAGLVTGTSEIVNISVNGVGAKSTYFGFENPFNTSGTNYTKNVGSNTNNFIMFSSEKDVDNISRITNVDKISYAGGVIGILDVDTIEENDESTLRAARARRMTINGAVNIVGEVVGGVFGGMGRESAANDINFIVDTSQTKLNATRVVGGLVGDMRGKIDRSAIHHSATVQDTIDKAYKSATVSDSYTFVKNHSSNYNQLYIGNPVYMGGIAGINIGGRISNSYNKLNVINLNAMYGGGIIGLNSGGEILNSYTTASVYAFKVIGGIIGLQVQTEIVDNESELLSAYDVMGIESKNKSDDLKFINFKDSKFVNATSKTILNGVLGMNVWIDKHITQDRQINYIQGDTEVVIGSMVGKLVLSTSNASNKYELKDAFDTSVGSALQVERRKYNEVNYFNLVILNPKSNSLPKDSTSKYVQEIGAVNSSNIISYVENTKHDISVSESGDIISVIVDDVRNESKKDFGVSGNAYNYIENEVERSGVISVEKTAVSYHYSRLQNLASGRSLKEFINRIYINTSANIYVETTSLNGGIVSEKLDKVNDIVNGDYKVVAVRTPLIYSNWPINYWDGTQLNYDENYNRYILVDEKHVFPAISPKGDLKEVQVRTAQDLTKMHTYKRATFILMNDIDLITEMWEPVGTGSEPFKGVIKSDESSNEKYTISNLIINSAINQYVGLVGFGENTEFTNFNLKVNNINVSSNDELSPYVIGSLYGYSNGAVVNGVDITSQNENIESSINASSVMAIGAMAGISLNTEIDRVNIKNINISVSSLSSAVDHGDTSGVYVGGAVGYYTNNKEIAVNSLKLNNVYINVLGKNTDKYIDSNFNGSEIAVGGLFGKLESNNGNSNMQLSKIIDSYATYSDVDAENIIADIKFENFNNNSKLENVYVAGIIGHSVNVDYIVEDITESVNGFSLFSEKINTIKNNVLLKSKNYKNHVYLSNMFGKFLGSYSYINEVSNIVVDKSALAYHNYQFNNNTQKNAYIGGLFAYAENVMAHNISFEEHVIDYLSRDNSTINNLFVGGVVGKATNVFNISNIVVDVNIYSTSKTVGEIEFVGQKTLNSSIGGFAGEITAVNKSTYDNHQLNSKINEYERGLSKIAVGGSINVVANNSSIGGLIGKLLSINLSESFANVDIATEKDILYSNNNIGGLVGLVNTNSILVNGVSMYDGESQIANSYATGDIAIVDLLSVGNNYVGGLVGNIIVGNSNKNRISILSTYSISRIIYDGISSDVNYKNYTNTQNLGGLVGGINSQYGEYDSNILIVNGYYNSDLTPYGNKIGDMLTTDQMLFAENDSNAFVNYSSEGGVLTSWFGSDSVWNKVVNNIQYERSYPRLNWIEYTDYTNYQSKGTRQYPETYLSSAFADGKTYILNTEFNLQNQRLNNVVVYSTNNGSFKNTILSTDKHTYLYNSVFNNVNSDTVVFIADNKGVVHSSNKSNFIVDVNEGFIIYSSLDTLNINLGVVDMVSKNDGFSKITSNGNGIIINSLIDLSSSVFGTIHNSYYTYGGNYKYYGYDVEYPLVEKSLRNIYEFRKNNAFDYNEVWVQIVADNNGNTVLNGGMPQLQWKLKEHYSQNDFKQEYYLGNDIYYEVETMAGSVYDNFNDFVGYLNNLNEKIINIHDADSLGSIAYMSNGQNVVSVVNHKVDINNNTNLNSFKLETISQTSISSDNKVKTIIVKDYKYGVETTTTKLVYDFTDFTLNISNDIYMTNKIYIPIGYDNSGIEISTQSESELIDENLDANVFRGQIDGNAFIIHDMTVFNNGKNAGLISVAQINGKNINSEDSSFIKDLTIKNALIISLSDNSSAGAFVGKLFVGNKYSSQIDEDTNYIFSKVASSYNYIVSENIAGGLFGSIYNLNNIYTQNIGIAKSYSTAFVSTDTASENGFGYVGNRIDVKLNQVYFAGNLVSKSLNNSFGFVSSGDSVYGYVNSYSIVVLDGLVSNLNTSAYTTTINKDFINPDLVSVISTQKLQTEALKNYTWEDESIASWMRMHGFNNGYPVINIEMDYWINYSTAPSEYYTSTKTYFIKNERELAWIAYQTLYNDTIDGFAGYTFMINNDLDLSGKVWTPIGVKYTDEGGQLINRPFKGRVTSIRNINGLYVKIKNVVVNGLYLKNNNNEFELISKNNIGLFGYIEDASLNNMNLENSSYSTGLASMIVGKDNVGGFVGYAYNSSLVNLESGAFVSGINNVGGVVGLIETTTTKSITNLRGYGVVYGRVDNTAGNANKYGTGGVVGSALASGVDNKTELNDLLVFISEFNSVINGKDNVGGIVGYSESSIVKSETRQLSIMGNKYIGGVVGYFANSNAKLFNSTTVSTTMFGISYIGGSVGYSIGDVENINVVDSNIIINNESVTPGQNVYAGGVIGYLSGTASLYEAKTNRVTIERNYSNISVTAVGGVVGEFNSTGNLQNIYNDTQININEIGNGLVVGKSVNVNIGNLNMVVSKTDSIGGITASIVGNRVVNHKTVLLSTGNLNESFAHPFTNVTITVRDAFEQSSVWSISNNLLSLNLSSIDLVGFSGNSTEQLPYVLNSSNISSFTRKISKRFNSFNKYDYYSLETTLQLTKKLSSSAYPFYGSINGNDNLVEFTTTVDSDYTALFGAVIGVNSSNKSVIKNFKLNAEISESYYNYNKVAGLVAYGKNVSIQNVQVKATKRIHANNYVGILASELIDSYVYIATVEGVVIGYEMVGGAVGNAKNTSLSHVRNIVTTTSVEGARYIGGVLGYGTDVNISTNVVNNANITGTEAIGGIAGMLVSADSGNRISDSTNNGKIYVSSGYAGGLVGKSEGDIETTITRSTNNGDIEVSRVFEVDLWNSLYLNQQGTNNDFDWWGFTDGFKTYWSSPAFTTKEVKQNNSLPNDVRNSLVNGVFVEMLAYSFGLISGNDANSVNNILTSGKIIFSNLKYYTMDFIKIGRQFDWDMKYRINTVVSKGYSTNIAGSNTSEIKTVMVKELSSSDAVVSKPTLYISAGTYFRPVWAGESPYNYYKVLSPIRSGIFVDLSDAQTIFNLNEPFTSEGIKVYVLNATGIAGLLNIYTIDSSEYNPNVTGFYNIKVTAIGEGTITYQVYVGETQGLDISFNTDSTKKVFEIGEEFEYSGIYGELLYNGNVVDDIPLDDISVIYNNFNSTVAGDYEITLRYVYEGTNLEKTYTVTVLPFESYIEVDATNMKTLYAYGENIDFENLIIRYYNELRELEIIDILDSELYLDDSSFDSTVPGQYQIDVYYKEYITSFIVQVL